MSQSLSVTEVACHFAEYINRVAHRGECFVLTRGNKLIAEPRPLPVGKRLAELPALLAPLPYLSERDDTPFVADLTAPQEALAYMAGGHLYWPWPHDGHHQCSRIYPHPGASG